MSLKTDMENSMDNNGCAFCQNQDTCSGCAGCGHGCGGRQIEVSLAPEEITFLQKLGQVAFLPVCRFILKSSREEELEAVALAPVYLEQEDVSIEQIKKTGEVLESLSFKDLISLDYGEPLKNGDYSVYEQAPAFAAFLQAADESARRPGFIFDRGELEKGSIALTEMGYTMVEYLDVFQ